MTKLKKKTKANLKESFQFSTTDWQGSKELKTTIYLIDEEGQAVVMLRFDNFDNNSQAKSFIDAFKHSKQFEEEIINDTLH